MSKKTLANPELENALRGSSFFPTRKATPPPTKRDPELKTHPSEQAVILSVVPNERTERTTERLHRTLLHELQSSEVEETRPTERYSFEIYSDQKQRIEDVQYRYKKKTGRKLSASRIIREALEDYLKKAEKMLSSI